MPTLAFSQTSLLPPARHNVNCFDAFSFFLCRLYKSYHILYCVDGAEIKYTTLATAQTSQFNLNYFRLTKCRSMQCRKSSRQQHDNVHKFLVLKCNSFFRLLYLATLKFNDSKSRAVSNFKLPCSFSSDALWDKSSENAKTEMQPYLRGRQRIEK